MQQAGAAARGSTLAPVDACDNPCLTWLVAGLCADWCQVCQDYRQTFAQLASEFAGAAEFVWVDIEDDEDALGAVKVDDFPTLLIARGSQACHFAAVVAGAASAQRLLRRDLVRELPPLEDPTLAGRPERLRALRMGRGQSVQGPRPPRARRPRVTPTRLSTWASTPRRTKARDPTWDSWYRHRYRRTALPWRYPSSGAHPGSCCFISELSPPDPQQPSRRAEGVRPFRPVERLQL